MHQQELRPPRTTPTHRTRKGKLAKLRRQEIHSFVRHWAGVVPPVSLTVGMLDVLGIEAAEDTVESDYEVLRFIPGLPAMHA